MFPFSDTQTTLLKASAAGVILAGGLVWSMTKPPPPLKMELANYENQSIVEDEKNFIRCSQFLKLADVKRGQSKILKTLYDIFQCGLQHGKNDPCLGYKPNPEVTDYHWLTYSEVDENAVKIGSGIINLMKQEPGKNTKIGIFMKNCVEWVYVEQGCTRYSMLLVPLYDTLGEEACKYIINHVKCEVIFVDSKKKVDFLLQNRTEMSYLKYIATTVEVDNNTVETGKKYGLQFINFKELMENGELHPLPLILPNPDDPSTILFTSGTTGIPKGCVITHRSMITSLAAALNMSDVVKFGTRKEVHLSFLPLTHVYERLVHILMFMFTGKIAFFSGEIRLLGEEMKVMKPTILFAVPRILNRIYDKVMSNVNKNPITKRIFEVGLSSKMKEVQRGIIRRNSLWDYIIFRKIQAFLGGQTEIIMTGSAPVSGDVINFFRAVMGCLVIEGYGQSETTGPVTMTLPGDNDPGNVGVPVPGARIKLCDVPELEIIVSRDHRGEICVKGDMCIKNYYEVPELTEKLIDSEGWLHTGDVGLWTEKGQLKIVDRCKHIFKLAQGEYLSPERLENIYELSPLVAQIFVTGNSLKDFCVAIVVPDIDGWKEINKKYNSIEDICNDLEAKEIIQINLHKIGKENKLLGFEIVRKVFLCTTIMSPENGLLTPTLKLKRNEATKFFSKEIDKMYN